MTHASVARADDRPCEILALVLIVSSALSISIAEGQFYYPAIMMAAIVAAIWTRGYAANSPARRVGLERGQKWLAAAATGWLIIEWFTLGRAEVVTLGHFVMLLCAIIILSRRNPRDMSVLLILAMLLLVIGSIVSSNLGFGVSIVLFALLYPYALGRHLLGRAGQRCAEIRAALIETADRPTTESRRSAPTSARGLVPASLRCGAVALLVGVMLFFAFPRFGAQIGRWQANSAAMVTGDTAEVLVTNPGSVQLSDRPVMRVWLERNGKTVGPNEYTPYFRSGAMEEYQPRGRGRFDWTRGRINTHRSLELKPRHTLDVFAAATELPTNETAWLDQYYELLVRPERRLYAVYPAMAFESSDLRVVERTVSDQSVVIADGRRPRGAQYLIRSPWKPTAATARVVAEQDAAVREPTLENVRNRSIPAEIAPIARRVAGISTDDGTAVTRRRAAERIRDYLTGDDFQYTLRLERGPRRTDPIVYFLTTLRRGHCQYFASAMALMCQSLGIPARVAVGYCGGDFNKVGGYFLVRQSHAHAWVEVNIPGEGWVIFDPSPARLQSADGSGWLAWIESVLQLAQYEWITRVVAFDREQRRQVLAEIAAWFTGPWKSDTGFAHAAIRQIRAVVSRLRDAGPVAFGAVPVFAAIVGAWAFFRARRFRRAVGRHHERHFVRRQDAGFITDVLDVLATLGFRRRPNQTPWELVDSLPTELTFRQPCHRLVQVYYRTQYGDRPLTREDAERVRRWLHELRSAALHTPAKS